MKFKIKLSNIKLESKKSNKQSSEVGNITNF